MDNTYKIINQVKVSALPDHIIIDGPSDLTFCIFQDDYGYTPYKAGSYAEMSFKHSNDFWFSHFKGTAIDCIRIMNGDESKGAAFWLTLDDDGLKVAIINQKVVQLEDIRELIMEYGTLVLSKPEFNIYKRKQYQIFYEGDTAWA